MVANKIKIEGENVLVVGGAGFVGSQLVRELLDIGANVIVYDNFLHGRRENLEEIKNQIEIVVGDILDEWKLSETFRKYCPTYVFDLVGDTYVPTAYDIPKRFFRINVEGTLNVLMACKMYNVKRVLYVSSTEVYGEANTQPMRENHPLNPLNTYAVSKMAADRLCFTFHHEHNIPVIIARIYNSYGPRETEPYVIPEIITQLSKGKVVYLGNIEAKRDFTYVSDTAKGLIATMCSGIPNGEAVNIGSNRVYSIKELVSLIAEITQCNYEICIDKRRLRRFDINIFQCDYSKLHNATGWRPIVNIKDGLKMTVDWFNSHGKCWCWEEWAEGTILYDSTV